MLDENRDQTEIACLPEHHSRPTLLTVKQFSQRHPAFTEGGLRWLLFNREQNGFERAVVKVGRRVLIDVDEFFGWLHTQNGR